MIYRPAIIPLHGGGSSRDVDRDAAPSKPVNLATAPQALLHCAASRAVRQLDTVPAFDGHNPLRAYDLLKIRRSFVASQAIGRRCR
jgi:hypothetical protein